MSDIFNLYPAYYYSILLLCVVILGGLHCLQFLLLYQQLPSYRYTFLSDTVTTDSPSRDTLQRNLWLSPQHHNDLSSFPAAGAHALMAAALEQITHESQLPCNSLSLLQPSMLLTCTTQCREHFCVPC